MIRLARPQVGREEIEEITSVMESGFLTNGPKVGEFEHALAEYLNIKHVIAVSSGTAALHLTLLALGMGESDEVIVPDFTFPAVANSVVLAGGKPVFCDIDLATFNIDPSEIENLITERTKMIMPVHQFGLAAPMGAIMEIAQHRGVIIVEDAACALGADYQGRKCGTFGLVSCFSFHPRKIITTGEGGLVVASDDVVADRVRSLRNHGSDGGDFTMLGYNYRMSDLNAAIGMAQIRKLEKLIARHRELARTYNEHLAETLGLILPYEPEGYGHTYQSYVVRLDQRLDRDGILAALNKEGIEAGIGTYAVHMLKYYREQPGVNRDRLSRSKLAYQQTLSLPLYPTMSLEDVECVCKALKYHLKKRHKFNA